MRKLFAALLTIMGLAVPAAPAAPALAAGGTVIVEPQAGAGPYLQVIEHARHQIDVNSYLLTSRQVQWAVDQAASRGVQVQVLVTLHPYGGSASTVARERQAFAGTRVQFKTAPGRFPFDHAKYLVADPGTPLGTAVLGSSNLTYSGLGGYDRDVDFETQDRAVVNALATVINADWTGHQAGQGPRQALVLSPGAQDSLLGLIQGARHRLYLESEELGNDPAILQALAAKARAHVDVRMVLPARLSWYDRQRAQNLAAAGVQVRFLSHPYVHAKFIVADNRVFIGSQNLSWESLNRNREVGIILAGQQANTLAQTFLEDFKAGNPVGGRGE